MTYTAVCRRSGGWWAIRVPQLKGVHTQARRLDQVDETVRQAIALFLDVAPDTFDVEVKPEVPDEVDQARKARNALRRAEESAEHATKTAAETLIKQGYTVRDAGNLLGISPQRVSQITAAKTPPRKAEAVDSAGRKKTAA